MSIQPENRKINNVELPQGKHSAELGKKYLKNICNIS